ncbi:myelin-oligodendrocyte glycoprotein-like isoform X2 [Sander lucioperca]|uniref:myelin-oligodendrocyte glycoprotein-like isoform X2 n=1 Tax=Sander lucioperca TaxID=283035 RepID=UPI00165399AE|nr:myelin-oligodendrocyte glycoprotein-like isoform X2 [Sander lucioperca]
MKTFTSLLDVMMKILLITFLLFPETILGEYGVVCPTLIEAVEGDAVTLRGSLSPPVNLTPYTLDLKRLDLSDDLVHVYRDGEDHFPPQSHHYRGRTTLIHEDLIRGTVTLQISSVNLSDTGPYEVYVPDLKARCVFYLTVERKANRSKRNDSSTSGPPVEEETESDHRDGENRKTARAVILPSVLLLGILLVLVLMRGKIKSCIERLRGRKEQEPETAGNGCEMKNLNIEAAKGDEDLERAAGNGVLL